MSAGRVYVVRHGNTFDTDDVILRIGGRTDLPLSQSGLRQAKALARHFGDISFQAAYSSDLQRTKQTAEAILGGQGYEYAAFLKEIDYGPDEGRPETEVISRVGPKALEKWNLHAIPPSGWQVDAEDLRTAWQAFLAACPASSNTLVVTSNGTARFLLDVVLQGASFPKKLRTGSFGVITFEENGPKVESWNIRPNSPEARQSEGKDQ